MEPVVLFTTLGPNPAPLSELMWALARHQERLVVEAHVVVTRRGAHHLASEFLSPTGGEFLALGTRPGASPRPGTANQATTALLSLTGASSVEQAQGRQLLLVPCPAEGSAVVSWFEVQEW
ncbi:MAG: hypothetical protein EOO72_07270 [Myxococcaceae bacterium]|nr:MAG: hypothetical protein EOO72_07270 [Myxococcaceae bacterium]